MYWEVHIISCEPKFRGSMPRVYCTLKIKKEIIKEAYSSQKNVKATSLQVRDHLLPHSPLEKTNRSRQNSDGPVPWYCCNIDKVRHFKDAVKEDPTQRLRRSPWWSSKAAFATIELLCFEPALSELDFILLVNRVRRFCLYYKIVQRRLTHAAQNQDIMIDWVEYVNREIVVSRCTADWVVNIDQANIDFDVTSPTTLQSAGSRTASVKITGSSDRCTVIHGVTLKNLKKLMFWRLKKVVKAFKNKWN